MSEIFHLDTINGPIGSLGYVEKKSIDHHWANFMPHPLKIIQNRILTAQKSHVSSN